MKNSTLNNPLLLALKASICEIALMGGGQITLAQDFPAVSSCMPSAWRHFERRVKRERECVCGHEKE